MIHSGRPGTLVLVKLTYSKCTENSCQTFLGWVKKLNSTQPPPWFFKRFKYLIRASQLASISILKHYDSKKIPKYGNSLVCG